MRSSFTRTSGFALAAATSGFVWIRSERRRYRSNMSDDPLSFVSGMTALQLPITQFIEDPLRFHAGHLHEAAEHHGNWILPPPLGPPGPSRAAPPCGITIDDA